MKKKKFGNEAALILMEHFKTADKLLIYLSEAVYLLHKFDRIKKEEQDHVFPFALILQYILPTWVRFNNCPADLAANALSEEMSSIFSDDHLFEVFPQSINYALKAAIVDMADLPASDDYATNFIDGTDAMQKMVSLRTEYMRVG